MGKKVTFMSIEKRIDRILFMLSDSNYSLHETAPNKKISLLIILNSIK
jgi:hypothetical protein